MDDNIRNQIIDMFFKDFQDKIVKNEGLEAFYQSFTKKDLREIFGVYLLIKDDVSVLDVVPFDDENKKKEMVDYLLENYEEIYGTIFLTLDDNIIEQLQMLIKKNGYYKSFVRDEGLSFSIDFISNLFRLKLGKVNYNIENKLIEIYVPKELLEFIKKLLRQKDFSKKRIYINQIHHDVREILEAYGVLSLQDLTKIVNDVFLEIDEEELESILRMVTVISDDLHLFGDGEEMLVGNVCFEDEDEAYTFYESLPEVEYKIFTKEEYEELFEGRYHQKFQVYEELMFYLVSRLDFSEEELENFNEWFVVDYLHSYQEDTEVANHNLMVNLNKDYYELKIEDKAIIKKKLAILGKLYPSYYLKGYAEEEDKMKESLCV